MPAHCAVGDGGGAAASGLAKTIDARIATERGIRYRAIKRRVHVIAPGIHVVAAEHAKRSAAADGHAALPLHVAHTLDQQVIAVLEIDPARCVRTEQRQAVLPTHVFLLVIGRVVRTVNVEDRRGLLGVPALQTSEVH